MTVKIDRRKARTKQLLYEAFIELLKEKNSDAITVTDVSGRAGVNRGTFYLHYRDMPDMLQQLQDEVFQSIKNHAKQFNHQEAISFVDRDELYPVSVELFKEIARHAEFLRLMFGPQGDISYAGRFRKLMASTIYEKIRYIPPLNSSMPRDYFIAYISYANFGMLLHWIESGLNQTPEQMTRMMMQVMHYGPLVSLGLREAPGERN
ncbi:TetR family transcriptional regulator [Paenibacillus chitinolyticus]|uniref:TetR/AcrR family transcriptional regulator n=1 Tax=Paenibacillus chitinolyticus TaxID=79263 RepID=UPI0026E50064|nr:TetR/AcrR family transcriptional regulator [Paenibacillus chitinolyticus]GKS13746.1 TetR family transcriptional regulator [Paenibacillus chitinolyticus]